MPGKLRRSTSTRDTRARRRTARGRRSEECATFDFVWAPACGTFSFAAISCSKSRLRTWPATRREPVAPVGTSEVSLSPAPISKRPFEGPHAPRRQHRRVADLANATVAVPPNPMPKSCRRGLAVLVYLLSCGSARSLTTNFPLNLAPPPRLLEVTLPSPRARCGRLPQEGDDRPPGRQQTSKRRCRFP